jgi:undecaprenyl-diphosphatase
MPLQELIGKIDNALLFFINNDSDHAMLDKIMPLLRNPYTWIPLYLFLSIYATRTMKHKAVWFFIVSIACFAFTDSVSFWILKPLFHRLRPCHNPELAGLIRQLVDCGGEYSMPSSHAANHFGLATFWYLALFFVTGKKWKWLFGWAAAICYAQVYVAKHYPSDILAGALLGMVTGLLAFAVFKHWWKLNHALPGNMASFSPLFRKKELQG